MIKYLCFHRDKCDNDTVTNGTVYKEISLPRLVI